MYDLAFQGAQAYNQIGLFVGALICLGLGGLLLGNALYWRVHALHASGTVIGVIARNGSYAPVYRYVLADGQSHEAKSDVSSSSISGKETGRTVRLMISTHNPTHAREADSYWCEIGGTVLVVPGLLLGYTAITAYPVTWMTWLMAAALIVYLAERGRRVFIPRGQRVSIAEWRQQRGLDQTTINLADVTPIEQLVSAADVQTARAAQLQNSRKAVPFVALFAVLLVGIGLFQMRALARLESTGLRTQGTVVRMTRDATSGNTRDATYHAIVRFRTERNMPVEFKDGVGTNPPTLRAGDKVTVLYLAEDPGAHVMVDRGAFWNWTIPGLLLLGGGFLVWLTMFLRRSAAPQAPVGGLASAPHA